jgi:hypothetical protein
VPARDLGARTCFTCVERNSGESDLVEQPPPRGVSRPRWHVACSSGTCMNRPILLTTATVLAVGLASSVLGCGSANGTPGSGASASGDDGGLDAGTLVPSTDGALLDAAPSNGDAAPADAGQLPCGDASCDPSQICLTPAYGCVAGPPDDAGVCPAGTQYDDASDRCDQLPPAPSCVSPTPGQQYDCSWGDVPESCSIATAPIPSECSRMCRLDCA